MDRSAAYVARYIAKNIVKSRTGQQVRGATELRHRLPGPAQRLGEHGRNRENPRIETGRSDPEVLPADPEGHHRTAQPAAAHLPRNGPTRTLRPGTPEFTWEKTDKAKALEKQPARDFFSFPQRVCLATLGKLQRGGLLDVELIPTRRLRVSGYWAVSVIACRVIACRVIGPCRVIGSRAWLSSWICAMKMKLASTAGKAPIPAQNWCRAESARLENAHAGFLVVSSEQELTPNTALTVGYVGSHGYHELMGVDANEPFPPSARRSPCPAVYPTVKAASNPPVTIATGFPAGSPFAGAPVPAGSYYIPAGTPKPNRVGDTWTWFSLGDSSYNALQVDVSHRFSQGSPCAARTRGPRRSMMEILESDNGGECPGTHFKSFRSGRGLGLATYDVRNIGVVDVYALPLGPGKPFASRRRRLEQRLVSGWSVSSIVTLQSGFPFTPQLSYNPSNNGDTRNPVDRSKSGILRQSDSGKSGPIDPNAFIAPPGHRWLRGQPRREKSTGPAIATWDFSLLKEHPSTSV